MDPTVTDWIMAITGVGTLGAAVTAGVYASRAAHWTKVQADAANEQVRTAEKALTVAQQEAQVANALADHQLQESARAARHAAETRVDALMPTVFARATPGFTTARRAPLLEVAWPPQPGGKPYPAWGPVTEPLELRDDEVATFRVNLTIYLTNHSQQLAQVDIFDPGHGEVSVQSGQSLVLRPAETKSIEWSRVIGSTSLRTEADLSRPEAWLMNARLWVRDLGLNAYDEVVFNADLRFFSRDGSTLKVTPAPPFPWTENVGQLMPDRVYDRLNAAGLQENRGRSGEPGAAD